MEDEKSPPEPDTQQTGGGQEEPPPFKPDPRLVTYLERGRKDDAPEKFRRALEEFEDRSP
jgi:hypothetical protein